MNKIEPQSGYETARVSSDEAGVLNSGEGEKRALPAIEQLFEMMRETRGEGIDLKSRVVKVEGNDYENCGEAEITLPHDSPECLRRVSVKNGDKQLNREETEALIFDLLKYVKEKNIEEGYREGVHLPSALIPISELLACSAIDLQIDTYDTAALFYGLGYYHLNTRYASEKADRYLQQASLAIDRSIAESGAVSSRINLLKADIFWQHAYSKTVTFNYAESDSFAEKARKLYAEEKCRRGELRIDYISICNKARRGDLKSTPEMAEKLLRDVEIVCEGESKEEQMERIKAQKLVADLQCINGDSKREEDTLYGCDRVSVAV